MEKVIGSQIFNHTTPKRTLENGFIENKWVKLYYRETTHPIEGVDIELDIWQWTYLVSPVMSEKALSNFNADLSWDERSALLYDNSFVRDVKEGFESIITVMSFDGINPRRKQIRINEDLIFMFHLYETIDNEGNRNYTQFNDGEEKVIIVVSKNEVKILHQYLYDFLASKKMNLVCAIRSELNMPPSLTSYIGCQYTYTGPEDITDTTGDSITNFSVTITNGIEFQSWFKGKKIFAYKEFGEFKSSFDDEYADFIVGYDPNNCSEFCVSCLEDSHKYSRTFFKKGVLERYRLDPNAKVEEKLISSTYFGLRCDNDNPKHIWAYLKDLRCIPYTEQLHWKRFNYLPDNDSPSQYYLDSQTNWNARSSSPDFVFRHLFKKANDLWKNKFGWYLFKPTTGLQENHLQRIFLVGEDKYGHFESLILMLNVVLRESIDKVELVKAGAKNNEGSVVVLSYFLESKGQKMTPIVNFLYKVGTLRSLTEAHRIADFQKLEEKKRKQLEESMDFIGLSLEKNNYVEASLNLFVKANEAFQWLISFLSSYGTEE